jgi:hypothetical protein
VAARGESEQVGIRAGVRVEEIMQAPIENLLGEASLQARKVGEAAVVVDDVVRTVRERGEQLERVVVREGLARLQTRDAASLQQVKGYLPVDHKG